ncbi:MAG: metal-dependent hydrolase [Candidatus Methanoperedens sp.]|nr:metal-dependent hydrolase [Candidatus Methanoperedens sp.]
MNKQQHLIIGAIAFFLYTYLINSFIKIPNDTVVYAFIAVILGSMIPDILEAPTNWMHRGLGHSKRALKLMGKIFAVTALIGILSYVVYYFSIFYIISNFFLGDAVHPFLLSYVIYIFSIFYVISNFFLGYAVHLLADATTKVGLPD